MIERVPDRFCLTEELIATYLKRLVENGMKQTSADKYRSPIKDLYHWAGEDEIITSDRLKEWRKSVEDRGYAKNTIQTYITTVNTFLRGIGYEVLCIPKPPKNDLTGQTFGYLTAIEPVGRNNRRSVIWRCKCKCGKEVDVAATLLITMNSTSCGCLKTEKIQHSQRYVDGTSLTASLRDNPISERAASGYTGVRPKRGKWEAYIQYKKKVYVLGTYTKIEDAVRARAKAKALVMEDAEQLYEDTIDFFGEMPARPPKPVHKKQEVVAKTIATKAKRSDNSSGHTGVKLSYGKWNADITFQKTRYFLGAHTDIETAINTRKLAEQYVAEGDLEALQSMSTGSASTVGKKQNTKEEECYGQAK